MKLCENNKEMKLLICPKHLDYLHLSSLMNDGDECVDDDDDYSGAFDNNDNDEDANKYDDADNKVDDGVDNGDG